VLAKIAERRQSTIDCNLDVDEADSIMPQKRPDRIGADVDRFGRNVAHSKA